MNSKTGLQLGLALLLLGVAVWLMMGRFGGTKVDLNPYQALGTVAAEEAAALMGGKGKVVLLVLDNGRDGDPVQDAQVAAFRSALKRKAGVDLGAVEKVAMDGFLRMQTGGAIPAERYLALRKKHADAALLVSFLPFPPLSEEEIAEARAGVGKGKVMVVSPRMAAYGALLKQGAFQVAIVTRPPGDDGPPVPEPPTTRAIFDKDYLILK